MQLRYLIGIFGIKKLQFRVWGDQWGTWQDVPTVIDEEVLTDKFNKG
jgi:hypothetical protein